MLYHFVVVLSKIMPQVRRHQPTVLECLLQTHQPFASFSMYNSSVLPSLPGRRGGAERHHHQLQGGVVVAPAEVQDGPGQDRRQETSGAGQRHVLSPVNLVQAKLG